MTDLPVNGARGKSKRSMSGERTFYTYILECADGSLYTGYTTDPEKRIAVHNCGKGARFTRGRLPVRLLYSEAFDTKSAALAREMEIKKLRRAAKFALIVANPGGAGLEKPGGSGLEKFRSSGPESAEDAGAENSPASSTANDD